MSAQAESRPSDVVGGYLAALSIFASLIALAWHPLRLLLPSMLLALISASMGTRHQGLARAAVGIAAGCFFLGMTITVVTGRPLW